MNQHDMRQRGFTLENTRFLSGTEIWLALDDGAHEGRRETDVRNDSAWLESLGLLECELYQRQLFYWLLIRKGPCIFPDGGGLHEGVPCHLHNQN